MKEDIFKSVENYRDHVIADKWRKLINELWVGKCLTTRNG
jgi:hypothetical protein